MIRILHSNKVIVWQRLIPIKLLLFYRNSACIIILAFESCQTFHIYTTENHLCVCLLVSYENRMNERMKETNETSEKEARKQQTQDDFFSMRNTIHRYLFSHIRIR